MSALPFASQRSAAGDSPIRVRPVTGVIGAEVEGVDLARPLPPATFDALRAALDRHLVLFFRGQALDPLQLRALVGRFGPVFRHPTARGPFADAPEVLELRREPGGGLFGGEHWHSDVSWQAQVGTVSVLHGVEIPSVGNDTCFANLCVAFEALSAGMQAMLRGLRAVHRFHLTVAGESAPRRAIHPVVRRHPATGREGLYLNPFFVREFDGMTAQESRPLLEQLFAHAVRHEFTCRLRWSRGAVALWDNRFTLHLPVNDADDERRVMIRATALEAAS